MVCPYRASTGAATASHHKYFHIRKFSINNKRAVALEDMVDIIVVTVNLFFISISQVDDDDYA